MKLGICIYSKDAETVWNALRFANHSIERRSDGLPVGKGRRGRYLGHRQLQGYRSNEIAPYGRWIDQGLRYVPQATEVGGVGDVPTIDDE
ncbi:MAG: hypothetical protein SFV81_00075 [Pirellulaceae bacterium]|nr:hypothetical protein [Pirellulaceae bacterium]